MWGSKFISIFLLSIILMSSSLSGCFGRDEVSQKQEQVIGELIIFNDDGAYTWFQDERAIISDGKIIIGSVASGNNDSNRTGDIDCPPLDAASFEPRQDLKHCRCFRVRGRHAMTEGGFRFGGCH